MDRALTETISRERAREISPVVLAFVGDAVCSLYVRKKLALTHTANSGELNRLAVKIVRAGAQAEKARALFDRLTPEEQDVFKRGRNAKKPSRAKSASVAEYNQSTGYEALVGYLYLTGQSDRLGEILGFGESDEN